MSLISSSTTTTTPPFLSKTLTLLNIPPELLLQILAHLPNSSSFYALSQTSKVLNTFLHTHAATLTNSLILTHHTHTSSILHAQHTPNSSGFLVPTHPLVLAEERRIQRDKILASGCHCLPCRLMLHTGTSSTSNLSLDSSSSSEQEGLISTCLPIPASLMVVSECRAKTALESTVKLTEAGPQFLVFLERYGWQVETRWAVFLKHQQDTGTIKEGEEDEQEDTAEEVDEEDGEVKMGGKEEERIVFEFMIGNYCVKKFLEDAERDLTSFKSLAAFPSTPAIKVKEKFKVKVKERFRRKEKVEKKKEVTEAVPAPRKMFGEIEKAPTIAVEKDNWVKGILWYHGLRFGAESEAVEQDLVTGSDETAKIKSKSKGRSCMNSVNVGMKKVGSSMGHWFRRLRCGGDFQSLDD